jgi:chemotaxis protein methyltransferase CheR
VTIYFDRDTTGRLMARLHSCLRDGGYLFLGHAETLWQITDAFTLIGLGDAFVYRRPPAGADRRHVLPERRTEAEPPPGGRERRSPARDRRRGAELPATPATATPEADRPGTAMSAVAARLHPPAASRPAPPAPTSAVRNPVNAVRAAVELGRYGEAADLAAEVTTVQPLHQEAHYLHGLALTNLGRDAEACIVLRKATYLAPDDGFAHFLLAGALERRGEAVAAAQSYRAAAATLGARPADPAAAELGGRRVDELAVLCAQQAERIERAAGRGAR